jgi:peptidoglycan/xylan/chitin deacetylase (PgdA/CDA1 family)
VSRLDAVNAAVRAAPDDVHLFFRDDDVGWDDDRLRALLDVFAAHDMPLDLAVIPTALHDDLAAELRRRTRTQRLRLHQHGYAHTNHEPEGRKYEFGRHRTAEQQRHDIEAGAARLNEMLGKVEPIFTPPWNRCTRKTGIVLTELGFEILARESRAEPLGIPGLAEVPIRVDWVKPDAPMQLADAIRAGGRVGVMFHHAEMTADDLAHAGDLLAALSGLPAATISESARSAGSPAAARQP